MYVSCAGRRDTLRLKRKSAGGEERTVEDIGEIKCYRGRSICLAVSGFTKAE